MNGLSTELVLRLNHLVQVETVTKCDLMSDTIQRLQKRSITKTDNGLIFFFFFCLLCRTLMELSISSEKICVGTLGLLSTEASVINTLEYTYV